MPPFLYNNLSHRAHSFKTQYKSYIILWKFTDFTPFQLNLSQLFFLISCRNFAPKWFHYESCWDLKLCENTYFLPNSGYKTLLAGTFLEPTQNVTSPLCPPWFLCESSLRARPTNQWGADKRRTRKGSSPYFFQSKFSLLIESWSM